MVKEIKKGVECGKRGKVWMAEKEEIEGEGEGG